MKSILVVAAEDFEFAGILGRAQKVERPGWTVRFSRIAMLNGMRLMLVANGPGPGLAGEAADDVNRREEFDAVVSVGLCGALDPRLALGEIFVATHVNDSESLQPATAENYRRGRLVSIDRIVGTADEKAGLYSAGFKAVEMEAAALAGRAAQWGKPFYCVRAVSDTAMESFGLDLNQMRDGDGRFSKPRIVMQALKSPVRLIPELWRLNRNSGRAAKALGDFFANCSF